MQRTWCKFALLLSTATSYYVRAGTGFPTISAEIQTSTQAWKLIEQDYTLRLSLVAHEWATEHLRAWNAVFAEGRKRGNAAYCGPALVEMEIANAEKRADWAYRTCCEIWEIQGRTKCRALFRAIFDSSLQPMFSVREGCFRHGLELHQKRTSLRIPQGLPTVIGVLKQEMDRLRVRWNTKLEIAARDNEYQKQRTRSEKLEVARTQTPLVGEGMPHSNGALLTMKQVGAVASSFTWRELENRFREIQAKAPVRQRVSAVFTRTEWDSGFVTEEWRILGDSVCRTEFERLASIAARKLGYARRKDAVDLWLDRVREWLQQTGLDKNEEVTWCPTGCGSDEDGNYKTAFLNTERIAELSAMFCVELMAQGVQESAVSLPLERPEIADRQSRPERARRKLNKTKTQLRKMSVLFGAIQSGLKGQKYCAALDNRKLRIPEPWIEKGCPDTFVKAYREPKWQKRIQDEKSRYREQYDQTPAREREAIIQSEIGTRLTRH